MPENHVLRPFKTPAHRHEQCVADAVAAAEAECQRRGHRLTDLRRRVLELVWNSHEPVKAYDLLNRLRGERRGAAPPTVYRALEFLQNEGLVHRIESLNAFVGCGEPHRRHIGQFLICEHCGTVAEMDDSEVSALLAQKAAGLGFLVSGEVIELRGICADCTVRLAGSDKP